MKKTKKILFPSCQKKDEEDNVHKIIERNFNNGKHKFT